MLKKITLIFIAIILMINMYSGVIYATEEQATPTETTGEAGGNAEAGTTDANAQNNNVELIQTNTELAIVKAKVIEARRSKKSNNRNS